MKLQNKNAIIYGGAGSLGSTIASAFATEGATVFLAGRNINSLQKIKNEIIKNGGKAEAAQVDALNEQSVATHIHEIVSKHGTVDISFNLIGFEVKQNIPLIELTLDDFVHPITTAMTTHFLTATAAARVMAQQRSGVILSLSSTPGGIGYPLVGAWGIVCNAIESFSRNLATEVGIHGIRVVSIRSAGSPDSRVFTEAIDNFGDQAKLFIKKLEDDTMLKKLPLMKDIANAAIFLSSDMADKITGITLDVTAGSTNGLNYKVQPIPLS
ncbi:short-chain dehydrogenase [Niastella vici]|uniref:Short-chain dehydrogenase n=1 Tax=Niastella vici TaxID=1703345 RepID=A0A1V9G0B3_9BACT|nr:SDR family oxidoreductase [Niastella vici]OQP64065.1 short-chain dehydrogenase [Niastella vici]